MSKKKKDNKHTEEFSILGTFEDVLKTSAQQANINTQIKLLTSKYLNKSVSNTINNNVYKVSEIKLNNGQVEFSLSQVFPEPIIKTLIVSVKEIEANYNLI